MHEDILKVLLQRHFQRFLVKAFSKVSSKGVLKVLLQRHFCKAFSKLLFREDIFKFLFWRRHFQSFFFAKTFSSFFFSRRHFQNSLVKACFLIRHFQKKIDTLFNKNRARNYSKNRNIKKLLTIAYDRNGFIKICRLRIVQVIWK